MAGKKGNDLPHLLTTSEVRGVGVVYKEHYLRQQRSTVVPRKRNFSLPRPSSACVEACTLTLYDT